MSQNGFSLSENKQIIQSMTDSIDHICCLKENGLRCQQKAGNVTYNKLISTVTELKLYLDPMAGHFNICDNHKIIIQSAESLKQPNQNKNPPVVDLSQLHIKSLNRYKNHFNIKMDPNLNKTQMSETLFNHFKTISVNEKEVISLFIKKIKKNDHEFNQNNTE